MKKQAVNKKISVLIPTHKPDWYIERCLNSIEEQTLNKSYFKVYITLNGVKEPYEELILGLLNEYSFEYACFYITEAGGSNARHIIIFSLVEDYYAFVDDVEMTSLDYV